MSTVTQLPARGLKATILGEIKAWMGRRGVNQTTLSSALAMNQSQLSKRLRGSIDLNVEEVEHIAQILDVDPVVFVQPSVSPWPNGSPDGGSSMRIKNGYRTTRHALANVA